MLEITEISSREARPRESLVFDGVKNILREIFKYLEENDWEMSRLSYEFKHYWTNTQEYEDKINLLLTIREDNLDIALSTMTDKEKEILIRWGNARILKIMKEKNSIDDLFRLIYKENKKYD